MQFELSDEIINQIIFSMEDQNGRYVFDSENNTLTAASDVPDGDPDRYYALPVWDSVDGFKMMERFVASLRNPPVKERLRAVLFAGKGVFRGFKDVLKGSPEVENLWFAFKEKALKREIIGWYNTLCDSWGAEKIGAEPEETDELVCSDFTFCEEPDASDEAFVQNARTLSEKELKEMYDAEPAEAFSLLDRVPGMLAGKGSFFTLTVRTAEGECAGFIRASPIPEGARKTVIVTDFFIFPAWRGLGIGKSLFARCMDTLKAKGIKHVFVLSVHIPVFFEQVMLRSGFRRISAGFLADIGKD